MFIDTCTLLINYITQNNNTLITKFCKCVPFYLQISIHEDTSIGSVLYTFLATDPEDDPVTISSTDLPLVFSLSTDGILTLREGVDRELVAMYQFTVTASDGEGNKEDVPVTLLLMDINDNPPVFSTTLYQSLPKEGQPLGTVITSVQAVDPDEGPNGVVTYTLQGSDHDLRYLTISPEGSVILRYPFDYEELKSLSVIVRASDNGNPPRHSNVTLGISVVNVPDVPPVFAEHDYTLAVNPPVTAGVVMTTVRAQAEDNATEIRYQLSNITDLFVINEYSGEIASTVDMQSIEDNGQETDYYEIEVVAINGEVDSTIPVTISITKSTIAPQIYPDSFYISQFPVFLQERFHLGQLRPSPLPSQYTLTLQPTQHQSEDYFVLEGNSLFVLPTVTARMHKLNVSIDTGLGNWFDEVEIHVALLSNASLIDHHISFLLPNYNHAHLSSYFLTNFLQAISRQISCSVDQLQLVSIQGNENGTELSLLVLQPDLVSYMSKNVYLNQLILRNHELSLDTQWTVVLLDNSLCKETSCINFQQCSTSLTLNAPLRTDHTHSLSITTLGFSLQTSCTCPRGFLEENNCSQEINECEPNPCHFEGECRDIVNGYECQCPAYTSGPNCTVVCPSASCQLCTPNPCQNGGTCSLQSNGQLLCDCPNGGSGPLCEVTSAGFHGDSYVEIPAQSYATSFSTVFSFATVSPDGMILFKG